MTDKEYLKELASQVKGGKHHRKIRDLEKQLGIG